MKVSDPELFKKSTKILKSTIENIPMIRQSWKNLKYPDFSGRLCLKCIVSVRIESHNQLKCSIIILEMICGFTVCLSSSDLHRSILMNLTVLPVPKTDPIKIHKKQIKYHWIPSKYGGYSTLQVAYKVKLTLQVTLQATYNVKNRLQNHESGSANK